MNFTNPWALLLLLALPLLLVIAWPRRNPLRRVRETASLVVRSLIILLIVLALAGIQQVQTSPDLGTVFLLDVSDSVSSEAREVVLAPALIPSRGTPQLAEALAVDLDEDGFFLTEPGEGGVIATSRPGVYVCGSASGPKDIPDSVAEASGAAAAALAHVGERTWPPPIDAEPVATDGEAKIGVFVCDCGSNIAGTVRVPDVVDFARGLDGVAHAQELRFACSGIDQERLSCYVKEKGLNRCIVAACSPRTHNVVFQGAAERAGLNRYLVEMANIRDQNSWVHKGEPDAATTKAQDLVHMAVEKAKTLEPLEAVTQPMSPCALVVGGGLAGITAATDLARQGYETHLVEREPELGGIVRTLDSLAPDGVSGRALVRRSVRDAKAAGVHIHTRTKVDSVSGYVGNFAATLTGSNGAAGNGAATLVSAGVIILTTGATAYEATEFGHGKDSRVITNVELERRLADETGLEADTVTFVACVGSRHDDVGCSRYCCQTMIHQALRLREMGKHV
ncbi:MAG: FAD-dependent oxidoreductase, partial [Anaerolineae bacterium]